MATKADHEPVAPDEPGGEVYFIDGEERRVPRRVESAGRDAIQQWITDQSATVGARTSKPAKAAATPDSPVEG